MLVTSTTAKGNKNEETREGIAGLAAHKLELNSTLLGRQKTSPITHFMWNQIFPMGLKSRPSVGGQLHYRLLWLALKHPRLYSGPFLKLIILHPVGSCRLLCLVGCLCVPRCFREIPLLTDERPFCSFSLRL